MSDDEVELLDGMVGSNDGEGLMDGATTLGAARKFDVETGRIICDRAADDDTSNALTFNHSPISPEDNAKLKELDRNSKEMELDPETWMLSLAEKNANNTHDIKVPHMLGIDEAGRGPVLGSMVYGICWCPVSKLDELKQMKVADSKTLTFTQRQGLFRSIKECPWLGYEVDVISAERLSRDMMRRMRVNLNAISHNSAIGLIQKVVDSGVNVREIYVDTVGDQNKYQEKLSAIFPGISITVAKKADALYPVVSAASIAAKVTRDLNLEQWKFIEEKGFKYSNFAQSTTPSSSSAVSSFSPSYSSSLPSSSTIRCFRRFGSGYPGDPLTKIWLHNHLDGVFGYPNLVRFSWGTTKKILKSQSVQVEWGDEEEEEDENEEMDDEGAGTQKMDQFFSAAPSKDGSTSTSAAAGSKTASTSAPSLVTSHPNQKKFSSLHDSLTRKHHALKSGERGLWFQRHQMDCATTF